jgi:hypothetical protein
MGRGIERGVSKQELETASLHPIRLSRVLFLLPRHLEARHDRAGTPIEDVAVAADGVGEDKLVGWK